MRCGFAGRRTVFASMPIEGIGATRLTCVFRTQHLTYQCRTSHTGTLPQRGVPSEVPPMVQKLANHVARGGNKQPRLRIADPKARAGAKRPVALNEAPSARAMKRLGIDPPRTARKAAGNQGVVALRAGQKSAVEKLKFPQIAALGNCSGLIDTAMGPIHIDVIQGQNPNVTEPMIFFGGISYAGGALHPLGVAVPSARRSDDDPRRPSRSGTHARAQCSGWA